MAVVDRKNPPRLTSRGSPPARLTFQRGPLYRVPESVTCITLFQDIRAKRPKIPFGGPCSGKGRKGFGASPARISAA